MLLFHTLDEIFTISQAFGLVVIFRHSEHIPVIPATPSSNRDVLLLYEPCLNVEVGVFPSCYDEGAVTVEAEII
jgi:hypothetical protein